MPVVVVCSDCSKSLRLRDELAGKRIRCPSCSAIVLVPSNQPAAKTKAASPAAKSDRPKNAKKGRRPTNAKSVKARKERQPTEEVYNQRYKQFLDAFEAEEIEPVPITRTYQIGIALVCVFMLLLPFLYLGSVLALSLLAPLVMIPLLVFLIVKPLLSGGGDPTGRRTLDRDDEPLLFDFVDRVCEAVNAPYPKEINIDSQVNASASFRRGVFSMFGNDLTLTVGMPLVAGLTTRQLAGVLAHEFGHFAQGAGMRVTYIIRFISMWFTRIVYERDRWDALLESLSELPAPINLFFLIVRGLVWLCRRVMWCFMMLGHLAAGYMLRQMEFDADRYEARLAGSQCFARTAKQLIHLGAAHQGALADLHGFYREGRLADNLPRLIIANIEQLDEKTKRKIKELVAESKTSVFDTHPSDRERVARVKDEEADGIFQLEQPARDLFRRYDYQARAVTWDMYRSVFGSELKKSDIHPTDELLVRQEYEQENFKALFRFFQCAPSWYRPLRPPKLALKPPSDVKATITKVQAARAKVIKLSPKYAKAWKRYDKADTRLLECELAESLLNSKLKVPKKLFDVALGTYDEIEQRQEAAEYIQGKQEPLLAPFEDAAAERLYAALRLLRDERLQRRIPEFESLIDEVDELVELFAEVNSRLGQLLAIRNDQIVLGLLLTMLEGNEGNQQLTSRIFDTMHSLQDLMTDLSSALDYVPYPFDHADRKMTVALFMLPELPEDENPVELLEAADSIGDSLPAIQTRVLGRMCQIAEIVETALGLEPLPQPDLDDDEEETDS